MKKLICAVHDGIKPYKCSKFGSQFQVKSIWPGASIVSMKGKSHRNDQDVPNNCQSSWIKAAAQMFNLWNGIFLKWQFESTVATDESLWLKNADTLNSMNLT